MRRKEKKTEETKTEHCKWAELQVEDDRRGLGGDHGD